MLRNIPNRYTPEELLDEMIQRGFEGAFDFFYLPTDFVTKKNKGYGFLNLRSPILAEVFRQAFDQQRLTRYVTQKVLEMSPAVTQGLDANVLKYLNYQAGRVQNPWFKPMIFVASETPGTPWRCLSLTEENLPPRLRRQLGTCSSAAEVSDGSGHDLAVGGPELEFTGESAVDCAGTSDSETASFIEAAVQQFLRSCADDGHGAISTTVLEPLKQASRGRGRRRGNHKPAPLTFVCAAA